MMEAPLIVGIIFFSIVAVTKIVSDARTRKSLIEKSQIDEKTRQAILGHSELANLSNVKWGMVLVGIGLAAMLSNWLPDLWDEEGAVGLVFVFAGLGFLIYYPKAQARLKNLEKKEKQNSQL